MKITFLIPPVLDGTRDVDRCFGCNYNIYFLPLLPVLYAATIVKDDVERVAVLDFAAQKKNEDDLMDFIKNDDSDVYVFYTVFLCQNTDLMARQLIRQARPAVKFIFSGPQPTFSPEFFLDNSDTFVIRGEPESIIRALIKVLRSGAGLGSLPGVSYWQDSKMIHNPSASPITDIDSIPMPDRTLLDHGPYFNPKLRKIPHTAILTSRGCFGQCTFCVPNSLSYAGELEYKKSHGRKPSPRLHSPERVIEEFHNIAKLGFKSVSIIDDEFLWEEERTIRICKGIQALNLEWSCLSRADMVTEKSAKAMRDAGCAYVDIGTESFDEGILVDIKKNMRADDTMRAVRLLRKYGIEVELNIIFGASPRETLATMKRTLKEVKKIDAEYVLFSIANPFPGTDFYSIAKKEGWMFYGDYIPVDSAKSSIISYPHLSKKQLEGFISYAYLSYYLRPGFIMRQLFKLKNPSDFFNKISTAVRFFSKNFSK